MRRIAKVAEEGLEQGAIPPGKPRLPEEGAAPCAAVDAETEDFAYVKARWPDLTDDSVHLVLAKIRTMIASNS